MKKLVHSACRLLSLGLLVAASTIVVSRPAGATVTEPNGQAVPDLLQTANPTYNEVTLQSYFNGAGETIDAVAAANSQPGTFSPLCNFQAALVLSQSGASAGIAWYNVDAANPTSPPAAADLHHILQPSNVTGATINAADIRNDPAYKGGYIGFALTKNFGSSTATPTAIYYSEFDRNALCTDCKPPEHWITSLAYHSVLRSDTYYLAFEDWEGASSAASSWMNDGDFNDKVFKLVGISCAGGGLECDTGKLGLCGKGVTECALDGGATTCTPLYEPRAEVCDAIDNDCNGTVDDGQLCSASQVCLHGSCVFPCGSAEFLCPSSLACGTDNYCIEKACVNVTCGTGLACRNGVCTSPCTDVVCPLSQTCVDGLCKDLCAGKVCGGDSVCQDGACIGTCGCTACANNKTCDTKSGYCVDPGCETVTCAAGQGCVAGQCVDACAGAKCPGGAACTNGSCAPPPASATGGAGATTGGSGNVSIGVGTSGGPALGTSNGLGTGNSSAVGATSATFGNGNGGCGCRISTSTARGSLSLLGLLGLLVAVGRRRRPTA